MTYIDNSNIANTGGHLTLPLRGNPLVWGNDWDCSIYSIAPFGVLSTAANRESVLPFQNISHTCERVIACQNNTSFSHTHMNDNKQPNNVPNEIFFTKYFNDFAA